LFSRPSFFPIGFLLCEIDFKQTGERHTILVKLFGLDPLVFFASLFYFSFFLKCNRAGTLALVIFYRENATCLENTAPITVKSINSSWQNDLFSG